MVGLRSVRGICTSTDFAGGGYICGDEEARRSDDFELV